MTSTVRVCQWLFLAGALLFLGSAIGWNQYSEHNSIDTRERQRLATHAELIEKNVAPQLLLANRVIDGIIRKLPSWQAENDGFKSADHDLQLINDNLIGIQPILLIQADGKVVASSNKTLIGMNFAHRAYFQTAIRNPDPNILHVSAPFKTVLNTFVISLFRAIRRPNGEFGGIVIVSLSPEYFSTLLDSVRYAPDMRTSLIHGDGKLLLMIPALPDIEGVDLARPGSFFTRHLETGQKAIVMTGKLLITGEERMVAMRTLKTAGLPMDKPLVLAVARDLPSIFADWRRDAYLQGGLFGVLILSTSLGLYFYQRRQRTYNRLVASQTAEQKRSEEQFHAFLQNSAVIAWMYDGNGRYVFVSDNFLRRFSLSKNAVIGRTNHEIWPQAIADGFLRNDLALLDQGGTIEIEEAVMNPDGSVSWWQVSKFVFEDTDGKRLIGGLGVDITGQKSNEARRRDFEKRHAVLFLNASDAIMITDSNGIVEDVNNSFTSMLGYERDEIRGRLIEELHPGAELVSIRRNFSATVAGPLPPSLQTIIYRKDGMPMEVEIRATMIEIEGRKVVQGIFIDLTERKRLEQQRVDKEKAHLATLVREVHHRIKNNLQSVAGLLHRELGKFLELDPHLETAISQVNIIAVVHGLQGVNAHEETHLFDVVQNICKSVADLEQRPVRFHAEQEEASNRQIRIENDEAVSVALVLNELILNALKHSPHGSSAPQVSLNVIGNSVQIVIGNDTAGAPDFNIDTGKGIGTGLSLVRSLLPEQGAQLTYKLDMKGYLMATLTLASPVVVMHPQKELG